MATALPFIVFTGRPAAGKSSILEVICSEFDTPIKPAKSTTTRKSRGDEKDGEYDFVSEQTFHKMDAEGFLAWKAQPYGPSTPWYGTTLEEVQSGLRYGNRIAILSRDSPSMLYAMAKKLGLERRICYIHFDTGKEDVDHILRERMKERTDQDRVSAQLFESRNWDGDARASGLPYHFVNALQPQRILLARILRIITRHPAFN